jgi:hypothetical protein
VGIAIRFVGGPADGRTLAIPDASPPFRYLIPLPPSLADLAAKPLDPIPTLAAEYEPLLERGRPRQADDGVYLYGHRAAPLTAERRADLEEGRRKARAAEEARGVELDEAWREIRQVRPNSPEDWRDAF